MTNDRELLPAFEIFEGSDVYLGFSGQAMMTVESNKSNKTDVK